MTTMRHYRETDAVEVGKLIADTFIEFNLSFASPVERKLFLGPFQYARSPDKSHQAAIARVISAEMVFIAEDAGEIVGVLRGSKHRLRSLFVRRDYHRQGVGRRLVERLEHECVRQGSKDIKVAATLFAIPFYSNMGYKRTTGIRSGTSFEGSGLPVQPMKKTLSAKGTSHLNLWEET